MSPTLLELLIAALLIVVAWQLGLALAPRILRALRSMKRELDEASDETLAPTEPSQKEHHNGTHSGH